MAIDRSVELTWDDTMYLLKQLQTASQQVYQCSRHYITATKSDKSAVVSIRIRQLLRKALGTMKALRDGINGAFLIDGSTGAKAGSLDDTADRTRKLIAAIEDATHISVPTVKELKLQRLEQIAEELKAVRSAPELTSECGVNVTSTENVAKLQTVIRITRDREQQQSFHAGLLHDQQSVTSGGEGEVNSYSMENFAYGSTPFHTWMLLVSKPPVVEAIKELQQSPSRCVTVFGSSSGTLVLFTALAWGVRSEGVEILPFLHNEAESLCQAADISSEQCHFTCADMLTSSLAATRILVLTSQCWDDALYAKVLVKAERELPPDALVVDYRSGLQQSQRFHNLLHLHAQHVSWSRSQPLFVFGPHVDQV